MICLFKCPGCGEDMHFDIKTQKLVCDVCNHELLPEEYDFMNIKMDGDRKYEDNMNRYHCPSCGATLMLLDNQVTCECSYCGTNLAVFDNTQGEYTPEKIIPFKIDKEQAYNRIITWWTSNKVMSKYNPKKLKLEMRCVYVPVWLFDANVTTSMSSIVSVTEVIDKNNLKDNFEKQYINMKQWELVCSKYAVPNIQGARLDSYKSVNQCIFAEYRQIPSIASAHFSKKRFHDIEPFDDSEMEEFTPAYLSGLSAEQYYLKPDDVFAQNIIRVKEYAKEQGKLHAMAAVGGTEVTKVLDLKQQVEPREMCYALVPMWIGNYQYDRRKHYVYVNGQTGKTNGDILIDGMKLRTFWKYVYYEMLMLPMNLILFILVYVFLYLFGKPNVEYILLSYLLYFFLLIFFHYQAISYIKIRKKTSYYQKVEIEKLLLSKKTLDYCVPVKQIFVAAIGTGISAVLLIKQLNELALHKELLISILYFACILITFIMSYIMTKKEKKEYIAREELHEDEEVRYINYLEPHGTKVIGSETISLEGNYGNSD